MSFFVSINLNKQVIIGYLYRLKKKYILCIPTQHVHKCDTDTLQLYVQSSRDQPWYCHSK